MCFEFQPKVGHHQSTWQSEKGITDGCYYGMATQHHRFMSTVGVFGGDYARQSEFFTANQACYSSKRGTIGFTEPRCITQRFPFLETCISCTLRRQLVSAGALFETFIHPGGHPACIEQSGAYSQIVLSRSFPAIPCM